MLSLNPEERCDARAAPARAQPQALGAGQARKTAQPARRASMVHGWARFSAALRGMRCGSRRTWNPAYTRPTTALGSSGRRCCARAARWEARCAPGASRSDHRTPPAATSWSEWCPWARLRVRGLEARKEAVHPFCFARLMGSTSAFFFQMYTFLQSFV